MVARLHTYLSLIAVWGACLAASGQATAQDAETSVNADQVLALGGEEDQNVISYPAVFFEIYRPITALDMVERVPGFQIDQGGGSRGFGGAAGNILIDGERPSTKDNTAADILARISATQVERIDLIRGQAAELNLRGQAVAVNVILTDTGTSVRWQADIEQDVDSDGPTPSGSISLTDNWGKTRYTVGAEIGRFLFQNPAEELLFQGGEVVEFRDELEETRGHFFGGNFNSETKFDETIVNSNLEIFYERSKFFEDSNRSPLTPEIDDFLVRQEEVEDVFSLEAGADVQTPLTETLKGKAIILFNLRAEDEDSLRLNTLPVDGSDETIQLAELSTDETETIARLEFDWSGWEEHTVELDLEGAFNTLENGLTLAVDTGDGLQDIPVPGANTRVEELRGDFALSDSFEWQNLRVDSTLAAETSTISQSGPTGQKRSFFFVKPLLSLTYAPEDSRQTRLRFQRLVAQLDFLDFVSATNFEDNEVDLGNPELSPDSTWRLELSHERRFGEIGAATVTLFHDWIEDVQDLLPIGGIFEVPGNIGSGRRYGVEFEGTLPLDFLGLEEARLDLDTRWQNSRVTDPVTGRNRVLSGEREFTVNIDFRQDFVEDRWAWGWDMELIGESPNFGIDEIDRFDRGVDLGAFFETTRWFGVKMRLSAQNLLNREFLRERTIFQGRRNETPILFREFRDRYRGRSIVFTISGSF